MSLACITGYMTRKYLQKVSAFWYSVRLQVAQFSGYVSEHSAYHHGEQSLASTIIGMAQNFVGSNNINLLAPQGQFGTREQVTPSLVQSAVLPGMSEVYHFDSGLLLLLCSQTWSGWLTGRKESCKPALHFHLSITNHTCSLPWSRWCPPWLPERGWAVHRAKLVCSYHTYGPHQW